MEGNFDDITLNTYWTTTRHPHNTPYGWGGVIAHEMMHNLGHKHEGLEYGDKWQINIFDRCVSYRGRYDGRRDLSADEADSKEDGWICGARN